MTYSFYYAILSDFITFAVIHAILVEFKVSVK